jgi:HEAT repeat protein
MGLIERFLELIAGSEHFREFLEYNKGKNLTSLMEEANLEMTDHYIETKLGIQIVTAKKKDSDDKLEKGDVSKNTDSISEIPPKKGGKTLPMILIGLSLLSIFAKKPAIAQIAPSSPQAVAVAAAAQPATVAATQKKIDELIAQLGSRNNSVRNSAVNTLVKSDQPSIELLINSFEPFEKKTIQHSFMNPPSSIEKVLVKIGKPAIYPLIRALKDTNPTIRVRSVRVLKKIGDHKTVLPLARVLLDEDRFIAKAAAYALVSVLGRCIYLFMPMFMIPAIFGTAVLKLFKILSIKTLTIVFVSAGLIGLAPFFLPKSISIGIGVFIFLGGIGAVAGKIISEVYYEDDLYDRKTGENPFSGIGDVQTIKSLIRDLRNKDSRVSETAKKALIPPLIKKLDDKEPRIRAAAARALGKIGGKQCIKSLTKALDDEDLRVREAAKEGLLLNIIKAFNDTDPQNRAAAARVLGKIGSRRGVKSLRNVLTDKDPRVRAAAAKALGQIGSKRSIRSLAKALKDEDQTVRDAAKEGLALIKKKLSHEGGCLLP